MEIDKSERIVHICGKEEWDAALTSGDYRAPSIDAEGYIHCSRPDQVLEVANAFYGGSVDLVLLCIDTQSINVEIRWEHVDGQTFPHVYGPINLDAVKKVQEFMPDKDGSFRVLPEC